VDTVMNITFLKARNLLTSSVDTTLVTPFFWDMRARCWQWIPDLSKAYNAEDEGTMFFRNVGKLTSDTASHPRRTESSTHCRENSRSSRY